MDDGTCSDFCITPSLDIDYQLEYRCLKATNGWDRQVTADSECPSYCTLGGPGIAPVMADSMYAGLTNTAGKCVYTAEDQACMQHGMGVLCSCDRKSDLPCSQQTSVESQCTIAPSCCDADGDCTDTDDDWCFGDTFFCSNNGLDYAQGRGGDACPTDPSLDYRSVVPTSVGGLLGGLLDDLLGGTPLSSLGSPAAEWVAACGLVPGDTVPDDFACSASCAGLALGYAQSCDAASRVRFPASAVDDANMQRLVAQCSATAMVEVMQRDCQTDAVASCDGLPLCWVEISHLFESYFQSCEEMGREPNHEEGCYDQSGAPMPSFFPRYCCFPSLTGLTRRVVLCRHVHVARNHPLQYGCTHPCGCTLGGD